MTHLSEPRWLGKEAGALDWSEIATVGHHAPVVPSYLTTQELTTVPRASSATPIVSPPCLALLFISSRRILFPNITNLFIIVIAL